MHSILKKSLLAAACAVTASALTGPVYAGTVTLTFGNLYNGADVENYFNGGNDSVSTDGTGPADGVVFASNGEALRSLASDTKGTGKFENNPSGANGVLYFGYSASSTNYMNVSGGFSAVSFAYSLLNNSSTYAGSVSIWSGLGGTGTLLSTLSLSAAPTTVACTSSSDEYCTWSLASWTSGSSTQLAESVTFETGKTSVPAEFDQIQLVSPTPLPATLGMMLGGIVLLGLTGLQSRRML